jgi:hypothetical protein
MKLAEMDSSPTKKLKSSKSAVETTVPTTSKPSTKSTSKAAKQQVESAKPATVKPAAGAPAPTKPAAAASPKPATTKTAATVAVQVAPKSSKKVVKEPEPEPESDDDDEDYDDEEDDEVVDFENLSNNEEEEESEDELEDDERETVVEGTDDVFDLDQFKNGSSFDQDRAEKAFGEWKAKRSKKPAAWFTSIQAPEVDEDAFLASRRQMTQRLIASYKDKLAKVEETLLKPEGLTKADLKDLKMLQTQYQSNIAVRELELSRK